MANVMGAKKLDEIALSIEKDSQVRERTRLCSEKGGEAGKRRSESEGREALMIDVCL